MDAPTRLNRREMLFGTFAAITAAAAAAPRQRLIIDTHLEVWTLDPKFPFNHPEAGRDLKVEIAAPIENQVQQMRDFDLRYAVLINPRLFGWDNSYIAHCLKTYPKLFVAHGLLDPEDPKIVEKLQYWVQEHGFQGMRLSPIYHPLSGTAVTDSGLAHLSGLTNVQYLDLNATAVTDGGLAHLTRLTSLVELALGGTLVTDNGIEKLQTALPKCRILH